MKNIKTVLAAWKQYCYLYPAFAIIDCIILIGLIASVLVWF